MDTSAASSDRPVITYEFGPNNQHAAIRYNGSPLVTQAQYTTTNRLSKLDLTLLDTHGTQKTASIERTYDRLSRLTSDRVKIDGATAYHADGFTYDTTGWDFLLHYERKDPGIQGSIAYAYDDAGRLIRYGFNGIDGADIYRTAVDYEWDHASNMTSRSYLTFPIDDGNTLITDQVVIDHDEYDAKNRNIAHTYDDAGRVIRETDTRFGRVYTYQYNRLERLETIKTNGITTAQFIYDPHGNRVREVYEDRVIYTVRLPSGTIISQEIHDQHGALRKAFIHHNGQHLATLASRNGAPPSITYHFRDRIGSPTMELSSEDHYAPTSRFIYAPFGNQIRIKQNTPPSFQHPHTPLGFAGHEEPPQSTPAYHGLHYMHARFYNQPDGRFQTPDPGNGFNPAIPASYNMYTYANANPVNFIDPDGNSPVLLVAALVGIALTVGNDVNTSIGGAIPAVEAAARAGFATADVLEIQGQIEAGDISQAEGRALQKGIAVSAAKDVAVAATLRGAAKVAGAAVKGLKATRAGSKVDMMQTGSYTNTHASGKTYSGKGSRARSQKSGRRVAKENNDPHTATDWTPAKDSREAFKQESRRLDANGGPDSPTNYNKIEQPGKKYRRQDGEPAE